MKGKIGTFVRLMMVLSFFFSLSSGLSQSAQAEGVTCTWEGDSGTDWYEINNWSCGHVPGSEDDVIIPGSQIPDYPVLFGYGIHVNSIVINEGASLSIDAEKIAINTPYFINNGTINIKDNIYSALEIYGGIFNNNGTVNIGTYTSWLILQGSGTHNGAFLGNRLNFNDNLYSQSNSFTSESNIDVRYIYVLGHRDIDIAGQFDCSKDFIIRNYSKVTISSSGIQDLGNVSVDETSTLTIKMDGGPYNPGETMNISEGETLSGEGTIQTNLINAGTVGPGSSPGTITVDGTYTQDPAGTLKIELGGTTIEPDYDQLIVTGNASLAGTLDINSIDGFTPALGQSFTIVTYGSYTGAFSTVNLPSWDPGLTWEIEYGGTVLVLHVIRSVGTISGTVTYLGNEAYNEVTVAVFTDLDDPPFKATKVTSTTGEYPYTLSELPDDTYFVGALMDLDSDNEPDPDEPFSWLVDDASGQLKPIIISGESTDYTGIDFNLQDPGNIEGIVTYTGLAGVTGPISVSAHRNLNIEEKPVAIADDIQSEETYLIEGLPAGKYYISAFVDLDSSGGPPGEDEPLVWYDEDGDGTPDQVNLPPGTTLQGIDIVIAAPTITSESSTTFTIGQEGIFTVETTGHPTPEITLQGDLPDGVSFTDNKDGTGTLSGTPAEGSQGTYVLNIKASNGVDPEAMQELKLTVEEGNFNIFLPLIVR